MWPALFFLLLLSSACVHALSPLFFACQIQKPAGISPLLGCPLGTVYVSQTDPKAHFSTIQSAVEALPDGPAVILIAEGSYEEVVNITRTDPLTMLVRSFFSLAASE